MISCEDNPCSLRFRSRSITRAIIFYAGSIAEATTRQLSVSERMPEFIVQDVKGHELSKPKEGTVVLLAFLSLEKSHPSRPWRIWM